MIAVPEDFRRMGWCMTGARVWFEQHGLDFASFRTNGIEVSRLQATGDPLADQLAKFMVNKANYEETL